MNILRVQRDLFAPAFPLPEWKVAGVLLAALFAESALVLLGNERRNAAGGGEPASVRGCREVPDEEDSVIVEGGELVRVDFVEQTVDVPNDG